MSETDSKTVVLNLRLTPAVMETLTERAAQDRQPVRRMAAMIIEDALAKPQLARVAPLYVATPGNGDVTPRFRSPPKRKKR